MLAFAVPDDCCGQALAEALLAGKLEDAAVWHHVKCGQEWRSHRRKFEGADVIVWIPYCLIEVFKP